jgi:hypothetical protein
MLYGRAFPIKSKLTRKHPIYLYFIITLSHYLIITLSNYHIITLSNYQGTECFFNIYFA